mgnify:CR=1 FL=1
MKASTLSSTVSGEPRYLRIADELMSAIFAGKIQIGALLPTEMELCERFGASRFTVREALRVLEEAGMVSRRPRAGTVVISAARLQPYVQTLDSIEDLLQYSSATRLRLLERGWAAAKPRMRHPPPIPPGEAWVFARLLRHVPGDARPVCLTRVYLRPQFASLGAQLGKAGRPVYQQIEELYGVRVARIEQRISACALGREEATALMARRGEAALRIVREYHGDDGGVLEVSDSLHPADRFGYAMTIRRAGPGEWSGASSARPAGRTRANSTRRPAQGASSETA